VGIGVFVVRDGKILLGKRKKAHGEGTWCLFGRHLKSMVNHGRIVFGGK
jgi:8-oxo-dGTP diphosphatase